MNMPLLITFCLLLSITAQAQTKTFKPDTALVRKTGADEHGMRYYQFVLLKTGPNTDTAKAPRNAAFAGHMANMNRLEREGKLVLAGPFGKGTDWRGLFVSPVKTAEEAEALVKTDPAIKAGYLTYELHPWFASAAVMLIPDLHSKVQSKDW